MGGRQASWRSSLGYTRSAAGAGLRARAFAHGDATVRVGGEVGLSYQNLFVGGAAAYAPSTQVLSGYITLQVRTPAGSIRSRADAGGTHTHSAYGTISIGPGIRLGDGALDDTGATLHLFDDLNRNGRQDREDPVVGGVDVVLRHASLSRRSDGTFFASHLEPYAAYQVEIMESSIRDPLLRPVTGYTFSFLADPGRTKTVTIALQRLPLLRGRITTSAFAPSRLKVVALQGEEAVATAPVYSDGGFALRLESGRYLLRLVDVVDERVVGEQALEVPRETRTLDVEIIL